MHAMFYLLLGMDHDFCRMDQVRNFEMFKFDFEGLPVGWSILVTSSAQETMAFTLTRRPTTGTRVANAAVGSRSARASNPTTATPPWLRSRTTLPRAAPCAPPWPSSPAARATTTTATATTLRCVSSWASAAVTLSTGATRTSTATTTTSPWRWGWWGGGARGLEVVRDGVATCPGQTAGRLRSEVSLA